jgi:hypothetical protein
MKRTSLFAVLQSGVLERMKPPSKLGWLALEQFIP